MRRSEEAAPAGTQDDLDYADLSWLTDRIHRWTERGTARAQAHGDPSERWPAFAVGVAVALALAVWMTSGAWGPRPPSGEDTLAHLVRAEFALRELLPRGRIDGWHPAFILGYQEFLFIGPGFTWAVGAVRVLSLGLLSVPGAFKVVFVGSFVVLPAAVAYFARSFGLSRRAAGLAAILTLAVNNPFGVGLQGLFNVGLVVHQFGAIFFFLTLGNVLRLIDEARLRWMILTAASAAALIVSHGISVILLGPLLAIVLLVHLVPTTTEDMRRKRFEAIVRREVQAELQRLGAVERPEGVEAEEPALPTAPRPQIDMERLARTALLAAGLAACTLLPFLAHNDLRGGFTGWGTAPIGHRVSQIWQGDIMFRRGVAPLVLAGLAFGVYRAYQGKKYALAMVAAPIVYLIVSHAALSLWPSSVVTVQLPNRGVGYVGILAMLPLAALIDRIVGVRAGGALLAAGMAAAIVVVPLGNMRTLARESGDPVPQMEEAAIQIRRLVPDGARFVTERDFPAEVGRTGLVNPDRWLAWASGRNTLNNFNVESSTSGEPAFVAEHIRDRPADDVGDTLSRLGVTHLVTLSDQARAQMSASSRFRSVWSDRPVAIFAVLPRPGQPEPAALLTADVPVDARVTDADPEAIDITYQAAQAGNASIAVAWSPKWHAQLDGRSVAIRRGTDSLIDVAMPSGEHRLELRFRRDVWDFLGVAISVATSLGVLLFLVRRRMRSSRAEP